MRGWAHSSGIMIGENVVLTCAHNIFPERSDIEVIKDTIRFIAGYHNKNGQVYDVK